MIILLGNDGSKWVANLRRESSGRMYLGRGLMDFIKTNGLKSGESFTLESTWENGTPMLGLFRTESTSDRRKQGERSEDSEKKSISIEPNIGNKTKNIVEKSDSSSAIQNRFVTLTLTLEDVRDCKLVSSSNNSCFKGGLVYVLIPISHEMCLFKSFNRFFQVSS